MGGHEESESSPKRGEGGTTRPDDRDLKQQRLPAWQPLLTPRWIIGLFVLVGLVFLPIGIVILVESDNIVEYTERYDQLSCGKNGGAACEIEFQVEDEMPGPVRVYYELTEYYQNHRRYVKSRSDLQLRGKSGGIATCDPLEKNTNRSSPEFDRTLYPCGLIANSMFTDEFSDASLTVGGGGTRALDINTDNIAWDSDVDHLFKVSEKLLNSSSTVRSNGEQLPSIDDEHFMVWMRTAGLPTFRKLYGRIYRTIPAGSTLTISATNDYPVAEFGGEKRLVISTASWLGGRNRVLGGVYVAVALANLVMALGFHIRVVTNPRPLGDLSKFGAPPKP